MGDDPPFLPVGTDVSAKYKGAFCEAKIKKVVRNIKCKVSLKSGGTTTVQDDVIKGTLRVGSTVEVKQDPKKDVMEAVIMKIQDCSQYTVVFDDGDITTLRRSALCLKSGRHFNESETLDQLPLTHPEHFSTPVIAGRRGRRGRALSDESEGEPSVRPPKADSTEREPHVGKVVLVESASGTERRRPHQPAFPALVVAPTAQIKVKEDYLVRSFKDGRYYTVPKKEACEFRAGSAPLEWAGVEAALQYLNNGVLPPHWDKESLFSEPRNTSDDSSDDEPREEKDHFVAQLYKFMDDRGTPLNRNPTIANKDIDLYRLFRVVQKLGGYNRVTNQNQWKTIADKMGFHPVTASITNLCKQAYKKYLHSFEEFYRKLGVTLVAHPRGNRTPPAGRSLIRDRDKLLPTSSSASSTPTGTPHQRGKDREKDSDKSETDKSEKEEKAESMKSEKSNKSIKTPRGSDGEDSADNQPLAGPSMPKIKKEEKKEKEVEKPVEEEKEKPKPIEDKEKPIIIKPRSESKTRIISAMKVEILSADKRTPKPRRPLSTKGDSVTPISSRASRRPHVSTDSDSSGRASRCGIQKKLQSRRSQSANSCSSGNTIASNSSKRPRKRKTTEPSVEPKRTMISCLKAQVGDKLKVYYGPTQSESKVRQKTSVVTYEAKVIEISPEGALKVHYTGWNTRYDEWIKPQRIAVNVSQHERTHSKKSISSTRRVRAKRTEESLAHSDSDSDFDSDREVKRLPNKSDDKSSSGTKTPPRPKESKSSDSNSSTKSRKRPIRTSVTSSSPITTAKKSRPSVPPSQGRDYDLNAIRSELKGLHTVKQEPEDVKDLPVKEVIPEISEPPQPDKQAEDVYEFKEPEPFEIELHDDKKKRTHRIFDDISPSKYTSTLSKSLSEEISEDSLRSRPVLRSPSLSPYRDFSGQVQMRRSPETDLKDALFSMDEDSFPGEGGSGPVFEGFTPAKNQETYSKKNKVLKLRELIDDSPDSPADDEQSSDDEDQEDVVIKEVPKLREKQESSPIQIIDEKKCPEKVKIPEKKKEDLKEQEYKLEALSPREVTPTKSDPPKITALKVPETIITVAIKDESIIEEPKPKVEALKTKIEPVKAKIESLKPRIEPTKSKVEQLKAKFEAIKSKADPQKSRIEPKPSKPDAQVPVKLLKLTDIPLPSTTDPYAITQIAVTIPTPEPSKPKDIESKPKPELKISKPEIKPSKPEIKPSKPEMKPNKPEIKPNKPEIKPNKPEIKPNKPEIKPNKPEIKPNKPENKLTKPENKIYKPDIKVNKPDIKINKPDVKIIKPDLKTNKPEPKKVIQEEKKIEKIEEKRIDPIPSPKTPKKIELPSSPLVDTEEDKSEPDSPARIDVLPEPPPGFLLHSEGPKIAEKLLKAINSAKRLSMSPPPVTEDRPKTPKKDALKITKPEIKSVSPVADKPAKSERVKTPIKSDVSKKDVRNTPEVSDSIFGEPSKFTDAKRDLTDIKKVKPKEPTPPRLQSPLNILERRKSVADLQMAGKNNKVLSDTIQKLSSQINQTAASINQIPLPQFPTESRSESSDSDDPDRRLIIDKVSETWPSVVARTHAGKSPGEWSAGESLLMLEDACKNARKHSANVVVAGTGSSRQSAAVTAVGALALVSCASEEDSSISLLLCSETIPGSPAPDAEPQPPRNRLHTPFASATLGQHSNEERRSESSTGGGNGGGGGGGGGSAGEAGESTRAPGWGRTVATTQDTTDNQPTDTSGDHRTSERVSSSEHHKEDNESRQNDTAMDIDKPVGGLRSRKASESSCAGAPGGGGGGAAGVGGGGVRRGRRPRRDTDDQPAPAPPLKYNFYVDLDPSWDCQRRINVLTSRLADLRKAYHSVKAELAAIDRRRKKLRRKEREAVKAAKAACS